MLSVKLLILNALIDNLTNVLCREETPVFFGIYLDMLDRMVAARHAMRAAH